MITTNNWQNIKFITILGPTASGKTNMALGLAEAFNGEIICADSRTIYRGLDIGTAKPSESECKRITHHLLDVVDPNERLSAAEFKQLAVSSIKDINERGKVPFLVGGSGLYIDSVIYDYQFPPEADPMLRTELEKCSDEELIQKLKNANLDVYKNTDIANRRRVIRALETLDFPRSRRESVLPNTLVLGLTLNKKVAQKRIEQRVEKMLNEGFIDEVKKIGEAYGSDSEVMKNIGYRAFKDVVFGNKSITDGTSDFIAGDMALYKKQITWFKRNKSIIWIDDAREADTLVRSFLAD